MVLVASSAGAQGNDRSAPTGGRSALMGNTGIALGQDGASPFMNPATIVRINDRSLAFSVNFYEFTFTHFSSLHQPGQVSVPTFGNVAFNNTAVDTNNFTGLPSTLCLFFTIAGITAEGEKSGVLHKGRQKLAFCLGTVEQSNVNLAGLAYTGKTSAGTSQQAESFSLTWQRIQVGPTYSVSLTDDFSVGLSVHGAATTDIFTLQGNALTSTTSGASVQSSLGQGGNGHAVDLTAILGATYRIGALTLGASAQAPSIHVFGNYSAEVHSEYAQGQTQSATLTSGSGNFHAAPPVRFALGAGLSLHRLTLEADVSYNVPATAINTTLAVTSTTSSGAAAATTSTNATYSAAEQGTVNLALGGEYFFSPGLSVLGGVSTNISTIGSLSQTMTLGNLVQSRTNWANVSFGIGSYGASADVLLGMQLGYGWGDELAVNPLVVPNDWAIVNTQNYSALLILAGSTDLRAIGRAVERVEHMVVTGNPESSTPLKERSTP